MVHMRLRGLKSRYGIDRYGIVSRTGFSICWRAGRRSRDAVRRKFEGQVRAHFTTSLHFTSLGPLYQSSSSMMFLRGLLILVAAVDPPVLICSSHLMSWSSLT